MTAVGYQRHAWLVACCVLTISTLIAQVRRSHAESDVELLSALSAPRVAGEPAPAQLTTLYVWPVIDLRPLYVTSLSTPPSSGERVARETLEQRLIELLKGYHNLKVKGPAESAKLAKRKRGYDRVVSLARGFARRGVQSYREVELSQAQAQLESALELFEQAQQYSVDPAEVAQLFLTLGLISVEQGQPLPALLAFREALLLNPRLRVREEFDGPKVAKIFEQARAQLISLPTDELVRLAERARRAPRDAQPHQLRAWYTPDGLFTTLSVWRGEHLELKRDRASGASLRALSALGARLWACLPVRRAPVVSGPRAVRVDLMYHARSFIESPVSVVLFQGMEGSVSVQTKGRLSTLLGGSWHVSGRDRREDLRADVSAYELYLGPQWRFGRDELGHVSGGVSLSASLSYQSAVIVSREVGCKYFELSEPLPPQLCQPSRDITRFPSNWAIGPRVDALLNLSITRAFSLHIRASAGTTVYESQERAFELPISAGVGAGYIFHLGGE